MIAQSKTKFIFIQSDPMPQWIPKEWKHIKYGQISQYLGSLGVPLSKMWSWSLTKMKNKLWNWGNKFLSLANKVQFMNHIFLASHVYFSSFWMSSKKEYGPY